jgi:spore coat polysaccharide biosynthesis protein SpsF
MGMMPTRTIAILQARMSSSRLPGKVMMEINGKPMIYWQINRIFEAKNVSKLVVATSVDPTDDVLVDFLKANSIEVHRGSLNNVLSRFNDIAQNFPCDALIRLTGDCPLIMPKLIDEMVEMFYALDVDYLSNTLEPTFPDGLDVEIFKPTTIAQLMGFELEEKELEHVTYGVYTRPQMFKLFNFDNSSDESSERWTVDYQEDLDFIRCIFAEFVGSEQKFSYQEVREFLASNTELKSQIGGHRRNEHLNNDSSHG